MSLHGHFIGFHRFRDAQRERGRTSTNCRSWAAEHRPYSPLELLFAIRQIKFRENDVELEMTLKRKYSKQCRKLENMRPQPGWEVACRRGFEVAPRHRELLRFAKVGLLTWRAQRRGQELRSEAIFLFTSLLALDLLHVLQVVQDGKLPDLYPLRPHKDAKLHATPCRLACLLLLPVLVAADAPIVLPHGFVEPNAHPGPDAARDLGDFTHITHRAATGVVASEAAPPPHLDATLLHLALEGLDARPLLRGRVRVEAAKLLSLLPREDRIGLLFVLGLWKDVLFYARGVGEVDPCGCGTRVQDLKQGGQPPCRAQCRGEGA